MEDPIDTLFREVRSLDISGDIDRFAGQNATEVRFTATDLKYLKSPKIRLIARVWGYNYDTGSKNNYEDETHESRKQPWGRIIQYFTDSLMRPISHINQLGYDSIMPGDLFETHFDDNLLRLLDGDITRYQRGIRGLLKRYLEEPGVADSFNELCRKHPTNAPMAAIVGVARFIVCVAMGDFERARAVATAIMRLKTPSPVSSSSSSSSSSSLLSLSLPYESESESDMQRQIDDLLRTVLAVPARAAPAAAPAPARAPEPEPAVPVPEPVSTEVRARSGSDSDEEYELPPGAYESIGIPRPTSFVVRRLGGGMYYIF